MSVYRNKTHKKRKFLPEVCDDNMTFEDCELAVLRQIVDKSEEIQGAKVANAPEVVKIIEILEEFLRNKQLVCYGGTAINNILPEEDQFYNRNIEIPDYDFFSPNALDDAKKLADIYYRAGYDEVEAKAGVHFGTYKVFVNFLPIADITFLHPTLFANLKREAIAIERILYAPPNYLRMAMYLELSRPQGDVSRWEKVLKRINVLNKHYPLEATVDCNQIDFQRNLDDKTNFSRGEDIYLVTRDSFIKYGAVFLGGYGTALYARYMPSNQRRAVKQIPDFDVLAENSNQCAESVRATLVAVGYANVELVQHTAIGEVIPAHIEVKLDNDIIAMIYEPIACHSYNEIFIDGKSVRVATIDTMLSFYLAFLYGDKPYFNKERMLCMAMFLFQVEEKSRLEQKGLLRRFSLKCYGKQPTLESIRAEKAEKFQELKGAKTREREEWFLRYNPSEHLRRRERRTNKKTASSQKESPENKPPLQTFVIGQEKELSVAKAKKQTRKHRKKTARRHPYARRVFAFRAAR